MAYFSIPRNGLVREYLLDGSAVDTNDGTKDNGTATNLAYVTSPAGYQKQLGSFNGSSAYVSTTYAGNDASYSISGYFRCNVSNTNNKTVVYKGASGSTRAFCGLIARNNHPTFPRKFVFLFDGDVYIASSSNFDDDKLHHFVLTATSGDVKLYVDNVLEASSGSITNVNDTGTFAIAREAASTDWFSGYLGAIRIYTRILTEQERLSLWHEFNRRLGGGSDTGAYIPAPAALFDFRGDGCDIANSILNTSTSVTYGQADHLGLNRCAQFNGSAYIDVSYPSNPITSGAYSICSLFKTPATAPAALGVIYTHANSSNNAQFQFALRKSGTVTKLEAGIWNGSTYTYIQSADLAASTWYAAVSVCNGASSALYVAQIGGSVSTYPGTQNTNTPGVDRCCIGRDRYNNAYYFTGYISYLGAINNALTADQAKFVIAELFGDSPYPFKRSLPKALQEKLWGWYDGTNDGTYIKDLSGKGRDLTMVSSPTKLRSFQNSVASTNGTSYAWRSEAVSFSQLSLVQWVKTSISSGDAKYGCTFTSNDAGINPRIGLSYCEPTTKASMDMWDSGSNYRITTSINNVNDGKWHFVAGTRNGTAAKIYFDGSLEDSDTFTSATITGPNFSIGCERHTSAGALLNGFHETFVFDSELTAQELQTLRYATFRF